MTCPPPSLNVPEPNGDASIERLLEAPGLRLIRAIEAGNLAALEQALAAGDDPNVAVTLELPGLGWSERRCPLLHALFLDNETLAHRLLDAGASPTVDDPRSTTGATAITVAIQEHRWSVVERWFNEHRVTRWTDLALLQEEALLEGRAPLLERCLTTPVRCGPAEEDTVRIPLASDHRSTPIHRVLHRLLLTDGHQAPGHVDALYAVLNLVIEQAPGSAAMLNLLAETFEGQSPLALAVRSGSVRPVQALLNAGADPCRTFEQRVRIDDPFEPMNTWVDAQWTPAHLAASLNHVDVLTCLLDAGADPTARTAYPFTPEEAGRTIAEHGWPSQEGRGLTALDVAQRTGSTQCLVLMEQRALRQALGAETSGAKGRARL